MNRVPRLLRVTLTLLVLGIVSSLLVVVRYLLRTPPPLESALPGEAVIYRWTNSHIAYKVFGPADAPPLVLLHEPVPGGSSDEMRHLIASLARQYRVYVPDLPGFGLSDRPATSYTLQTYVQFCQDFLSSVVKRPAAILASGLSCNIAVELAAQTPQRCTCLILLSPYALSGQWSRPGWLTTLIEQLPVRLWLYALLTAPGIVRLTLARQRRVPYQHITAHELAVVSRQAHQRGAEHAALASLAGRFQQDLLPQFAVLSQPVFLLWGVQAVHDGRLLSGWQGISERVQVTLIRDAGLRPHEQRPAQVMSALLNWPALASSFAPATHQPTSAEPATQTRAEAAGSYTSPTTSVPAQKSPVEATPGAAQPTREQPAHAVQASSEQAHLSSPVETGQQTSQEGEVEAYCVRCRTKRPVQQGKQVTTKNGRLAVEGVCPICGTKLFRFTSSGKR